MPNKFEMRSLCALGFAVATIVVTAQDASAFCRTTTCEDCVQPPNDCVNEGFKLFWSGDCVSYDVQQDASRQVPLETAMQVAARAFGHWQNAKCSDSGASPSIEFLDRGPVACGVVEFNDPNARDEPRVGGNANIIVFRDDGWEGTRASDPTSTLALTTVTFYPPTGEIFDADIEINSEKALSVTDPVVADGYDLESILTHEIGHFLGLAHSPCPTGTSCPTMHASYVKGASDFRTLEADDAAGVCDIYKPGRQVNATACVPFRGFGSECGKPKSPTSCGVAVPDREGVSLGGLGWGVALAAIGLRRRKKRRE